MHPVKILFSVAFAALAAPAAFIGQSHASDHADTPEIAANPGTDITDVYIFPSTRRPNDDVVLVMNVNPLIAKGTSLTKSFDPGVLYQFKIDTNGDNVEDKVLQVKFNGTGTAQTVSVGYPQTPALVGAASKLGQFSPVERPINKNFTPRAGYSVFAGAREDSFFFDLEQFFTIFPDRATPINGIPVSNPNAPQATTWRAPGVAKDFLSVNRFSVLSIVIELPKKEIFGDKPFGLIGVWATTSVQDGDQFVQMDRLARPVVNEVFATVANNRHKINDEISPIDDASQIKKDIESFMVSPAGRSAAIRNVIKAVLVPDVLKADLSKQGNATYLGVETGGATGGLFGGRALTDDVVDLSLGVVFGTTVSDLGLAPADGNDIPTLTSDNVTSSGKHFKTVFPYLGNPY